MSLAQDIRNAYEWHDHQLLEDALRRVEALEAPKPRTDLVPSNCNCGAPLSVEGIRLAHASWCAMRRP